MLNQWFLLLIQSQVIGNYVKASIKNIPENGLIINAYMQLYSCTSTYFVHELMNTQ